MRIIVFAKLNEKDEILLWNIDRIADIGIGKGGMPYFDNLYLDLMVYRMRLL